MWSSSRDRVLTSELAFLQDVVQQNNTLIEEMLYLIIMLVGEFREGTGRRKDAMAEVE